MFYFLPLSSFTHPFSSFFFLSLLPTNLPSFVLPTPFCSVSKATSCATSRRMLFVFVISSTINYNYVPPTAVAGSGPAVDGEADADSRGNVGTFQMCSCGNTAVSSCCAGCTRVANLWFWNFDWNRIEDEAFKKKKKRQWNWTLISIGELVNENHQWKNIIPVRFPATWIRNIDAHGHCLPLNNKWKKTAVL